MSFNLADLTAVLPEIIILALALVIILVEVSITRNKGTLQLIASIGVLIAIAVAALIKPPSGLVFNGMIASDLFAVYIKILLLGVTFLVVLISRDYIKDLNFRHGEYYAMILLTTVGMMILAASTNLITLFLGVETMSIALYVLAGFRWERERSTEAALKYLLLGAFSTGFLLYGIALIYGATNGMIGYYEIGKAISNMDIAETKPLHLYAGIGLVMIGMLFKVAAVPFHFWSPDVYQGAPTSITAFMSTGPKAAAFIAFLKLFGWALPDLSIVWQPALGIIAAITMIAGNLIALAQRDIKRMLAYSSVSHAGYLLLGVLAAGNVDVRTEAASGIFFYLVAYYLMNLGAFTVAILINRARKNGDYQIDDYKGLAASHPWLSTMMAVFMISLTGIPPTAGFFGKLYVFSAAVNAGFVTLVVIGVLASVVSAYYYLRIVVFMFMQKAEADADPKVRVAPEFAFVIGICAIIILLLGILPGRLMQKANQGAESIVVHPEKPAIASTIDSSRDN